MPINLNDPRFSDTASNVKLRNLILCLCKKSEGDERFGVTKLNKLVFYVDFIHYARTGESATGGTYFKNQFGPTMRGIDSAFSALEKEGKIHKELREFRGLNQDCYVADEEPDLAVLDSATLTIVDEVLKQYLMLNGTDISNKAKADAGIRDFKDGDSVPYYLATVKIGKPTKEDIAWAEKFNLIELAEAWHDQGSDERG